MKTVLLFLFVLALGGFYGFTHIPQMAASYDQSIDADEGSLDTLKNDAQTMDEKAFNAKYSDFLHKREIAGAIEFVLSDAAILGTSKHAVERYAGTPLEKSNDYATLLYRYGQAVDNAGDFRGAYPIYRRYETLFPSGEFFGVTHRAVTQMQINHGLQDATTN
jgi:hypothetical protein